MTAPRLLLATLLGVLAAPSARAQSYPPPADGWNGERALELIDRARQRRTESTADTGLVNYRADARLYVYFYLDREDTGERNLVKTDQLALEVFWQAPDLVKQRIVGWRDEKSLPTNIHYHLDHLTVVQENFGDEIRLGDGDEVRGVPHPAARGSDAFYQYRLADSLTLRLPGAGEPLRVYEVQVRPQDPSRPAFVGSVFVDRRAGDIVRMDFTFTAAAYVDRYLDYINISLDNGLWRGRFWLPNEQRVEIRRRIPQLDIPAGSVIRGNMRVGGYEFNDDLPPFTFAGPAVTTVPRAQRESFPFERDLHAEVRDQGLGPQVELAEIRRQAADLARESALRRVRGLQLRLPAASDVLRYNRSEGLVLGVGAGATPVAGLRLGAYGAWAFGPDHPLVEVRADAATGAGRLRGTLFLNRPRDVGVGPVASGAGNTLSSLVAAEDHSDLYFADGGEVELSRPLAPGWAFSARARAERQSNAALDAGFSLLGGDFRPVAPIDETDLFLGAGVELRRTAPVGRARWWSGAAGIDGGRLRPRGACAVACPDGDPAFVRLRLDATRGFGWERADAELLVRSRAGLALGELPRQELFLVGGQGTVPGYAFRAYGGDRFAIASATLAADLRPPWVRGRVLAAAGWTDAGLDERSALTDRGAAPTGGVKPSLGVGLGVFHDLLRVDLARGLGSGAVWELMVETRPSFWDFL